MRLHLKPRFLFSFLFITINLVGCKAFGFSSVSAGAYQGYQVIVQKESIYKTTSTLASLPTIGFQFQFQTTFGSRFGLRLKFEEVRVKFQTPPEGFLSKATFETNSFILELPFQHDKNWQSLIKIVRKERVLYNINASLQFDIYKTKINEIGYGLNYDTLNLGGLVFGVGSTLSLLRFESKNISNVHDNNSGVEIEGRAKLGWLYEEGWGIMLRTSYSTFYMPNDIDKNTGREIKFFGEIIRNF